MPLGTATAETLQRDGDAIHFVNEAFEHCKAIGATGEGVDLLPAPGINGTRPEKRLKKLGGVVAERESKDPSGIAKRFIKAVARRRAWDRQTTAAAVPVPA